jgi:Putative nucleotidyltransferase DUF294
MEGVFRKSWGVTCTDQTIAALVNELAADVTSLVLVDAPLTDRGLKQLQTKLGPHKITHLEIHSCPALSYSGICDFLCARRQAKAPVANLVLSNLGKFAKGAWSYQRGFTGLRSLKMVECRDSEKDGFRALLGALPQGLERLWLERCPDLKDDDIAELVECRFHRLRSLTIRESNLTESGFSYLGKILAPGLLQLDLAGNEGLDDRVLKKLSKQLPPTVRVFNLEGCAALTDRKLLVWAESVGKKIDRQGWLEEQIKARREEYARDPEGALYGLMQKAHDSKRMAEEIFLMLKLSDRLLEKGDHLKAAGLSNAALYLADQCRFPEEKRDEVDSRLGKIEKGYLSSLTGLKPSNKDLPEPSEYRKRLASIRQRVAEEMELYSEEWMDDGVDDERIENDQSDLPTRRAELTAKQLTTAYIELFAEIISDAVSTLGESPTPFACIGFGSMARGEMCRNSDLEWAIVCENASAPNIDYFRKLATLISLKVLNIGETAIDVYRDAKLPVNGFSLDTRVSPLNPGRALIGTPHLLAALQNSVSEAETPVIANAMTCATLIFGEEKLLDQYQVEVRAVLGESDGQGLVWRKKRGIALLKSTLTEFRPDLSRETRKIEAFGIKQELYRPLQETIATLALYYQLEEKNTFDRIRAMVRRGIFSAKVDTTCRSPFLGSITYVFLLTISTGRSSTSSAYHKIALAIWTELTQKPFWKRISWSPARVSFVYSN